MRAANTTADTRIDVMAEPANPHDRRSWILGEDAVGSRPDLRRLPAAGNTSLYENLTLILYTAFNNLSATVLLFIE
jgi:hypothetical protein